MSLAPLDASLLYTPVADEWLDFATTAELPSIGGPLGQSRAVDSIRFGLAMSHRGYNLFAHGEEGTGRRSLILELLQQEAAARPVPMDTVYLCNFSQPQNPIVLRLPTGLGPKLKKDLENLVEELEDALPTALESAEHRSRIRALDDDLEQRRDDALAQVYAAAKLDNIMVRATEQGFEIKPLSGETIMEKDQFEQLTEAEQAGLEDAMRSYQHALEEVLMMFPNWDRETKAHIRDLDQELVIEVTNGLLDQFRPNYDHIPELVDYFHQLTNDVADMMELFVQSEAEPQRPSSDEDEDETDSPRLRRLKQSQAQKRYGANVLVCHEGASGAPVIYEDNPTHSNLFGRVEYQSLFGVVTTDFTLIKAGTLHKANGGFLVLDARRVLMSPLVWEDLKRVLRSRKIGIEQGQLTAQAIGQSLEPDCTSLDIKVVLVGDPMIYYILCNEDPEFTELFKVAADFDTTMTRSKENTHAIALSLACLAAKEELLPLDAKAVAKVIEFASRQAEDSTKLSTHQASLADLVREADYWARAENATTITRAHITKSLEAARHRAGRIAQQSLDEMLTGIIHLSTTGDVVGQVNGLAVIEAGLFAFGRPSRITAQTFIGRGDVVDIEREVELGGPLHGKGVLILSSFLSGRFGQHQPLGLAANLVFEQSYGGIDGDSASSAELYALLSSLAQVPVRQGIAVTGAVDQFGRVQAIGGVNEKIEGFFALCQARGLTGDQGVMIPADNVRHLMLNEEVVEAVAQGKFHIYAISHVDQGIEILTGLPAGQLDSQHQWPAGSINRKVDLRLAAFTKAADEQSSADRKRRTP